MRVEVRSGELTGPDRDTIALVARTLARGHAAGSPVARPPRPWRTAAVLVTITDEPGAFGSAVGGFLYDDAGARASLPHDREAIEDVMVLAEQLHESTGGTWSTLVVLVDREATTAVAALLAGLDAEAVAYEPTTLTTLGDELLVRFGDPSALA